MARKKTRKPKLTARLGPEVVNLYTRKAGAMAHKLTKRLKTRGERERRAIREHTD